MPIYEYGKNVDLEATFIDWSTGNLVDVDSLSLRIYHYENSVQYNALVPTAMTHVGTGKYIYPLYVGAPNFVIGENYFSEYSGYKIQFVASPATILGSESEDFGIVFGVNDTFNFSLDGGAPISVTLTAGVGLNATVTGTQTEDFVFSPDQPASDTGSVLGTYDIQSGINNELRIAVDTDPLQVITIPVGPAVTIGEVVNEINNQAQGFVASNSLGYLTLTTVSVGASAKLFIGGGNANATLGFVTDSTFWGQDNNLEFKITIDSGPEQVFIFSPSTMDANQVVTFLNTTSVGFLAANSAGMIQITNTTVNLGYRSVIDIGNGTANSTLGFTPVSTTRGTPGRLAADIRDEINAVVVVGSPASVEDGKIRLTSPTTGVASQIQILAGTANAILGFSVGTSCGEDELKENFLEIEEFLVVKEIAPTISGLNVSFSG